MRVRTAANTGADTEVTPRDARIPGTDEEEFVPYSRDVRVSTADAVVEACARLGY